MTKILVDEFCELKEKISIFTDHTWWQFEKLKPDTSDVIVFSRQTFAAHAETIKNHVAAGRYRAVLANPTEGSQTLLHQISGANCVDLVREKKILLVGCGAMQPDLPCLVYDVYIGKVLDYAENLEQIARVNAVRTSNKPYKYLFLNGRYRPHRNYLLQCLQAENLLESALWTNLDSTAMPVQTLPPHYEHPRYQQNILSESPNQFIKNSLFGGEWGEIYLYAEPYRDTYFSLVSETVFEYPYSLRSEKTYKPMAMGHPFIIAANRGFYRDLRNLGFQTFDHLIDESWDLVDNDETRLKRIADTVRDLCSQDLDKFQVAAEPVTKYNQQLQAELALKINAEFPDRFWQFLRENFQL